jgi:penicillin amidase
VRIGRAGALLASLAVCAVLVAGCLRGAGPLPPLGPTFNPGTGVWASAAAAPLRPESLRVPGLRAPVMVIWDRGAVPHVSASRDDDLFRALGYLHARDRLAEMDLERRQAEGRLAQILGPSALAGDELQLDLGLARTAAVEWRQLPPSSAARQAIEAYSAGVNARIDEDKAAHQLPMLFTLLGYTRSRGCQPTPSSSVAFWPRISRTRRARSTGPACRQAWERH